MTRRAGRLGPSAFDVLLGQRIRSRRLAIGLRLNDLAAALDTSLQQAAKYEAGRNKLSVERLLQIAAALQTSPAALLGVPDAADAEAVRISPVEARHRTELIELYERLRPDHRRAVRALLRGLAS